MEIQGRRMQSRILANFLISTVVLELFMVPSIFLMSLLPPLPLKYLCGMMGGKKVFNFRVNVYLLLLPSAFCWMSWVSGAG